MSNYQNLKCSELKDLLAKRGLPSHGKKINIKLHKLRKAKKKKKKKKKKNYDIISK
ncbi:hypothetical protein PFAG_02366, partial [Plasmodium falciparum Santa Lucia]